MAGLLFGAVEKRVDAKGRISIPKSFRDELTGGQEQDLYIVMIDSILSVFTPVAFNYFDRQIQGQSPLKRKARELQRLWGSMVNPLVWDSAGRIRLTDLQKKYAGIDRDVVLVGSSNRLEIWSLQKYEREHRLDDQRFSDLAEELHSLD